MAEKKKKPYEIGELDQYLFGQGNHYEIDAADLQEDADHEET